MTRPSKSPVPALKCDPAREDRLAAALRANLKRRKAQAGTERVNPSAEAES